MPIFNRKPGGLLLHGFRLPIWLYRLNLGWVLGERFLLLTHLGRKSGLLHRTVIEVVRRDPSTGTFFVVSAFGHQADWFMNMKQNPMVTITVKNRSFSARARLPSEAEAAGELLQYAQRHPIAFGVITRLLTGKRVKPTGENCLEFVKSMPMVAFEPHES